MIIIIIVFITLIVVRIIKFFNAVNNQPKPKLNDSSIYISLAKLTDLEQIKNYYENNKDKVNDPENLRKKAREQYKAISDAKKMFEGVENG